MKCDDFLSFLPTFLDAPSHLYKRVCPSVRPSVCPYVRPLTLRKMRVRRILCRVSGLVGELEGWIKKKTDIAMGFVRGQNTLPGKKRTRCARPGISQVTWEEKEFVYQLSLFFSYRFAKWNQILVYSLRNDGKTSKYFLFSSMTWLMPGFLFSLHWPGLCQVYCTKWILILFLLSWWLRRRMRKSRTMD